MGLSDRAREWLGLRELERRLESQQALLEEMRRSGEARLAAQHEILNLLQTTLDESLAAQAKLAGTLESLNRVQQQSGERIARFTRLSRIVKSAAAKAIEPSSEAVQRLRTAVRQAVEAEPSWPLRFETLAICEAAMHAAYGDDPRSRAVTEVIDELAHRYLNEHADAWGNAPFKIKIREVTEPGMRMRGTLTRYLRRHRDQVVARAVQEGLLVSGRTLERSMRYGVGLDERVIELPLALDFVALHTPGRILDAGGSLNVPVFRSMASHVESSVVHVTLTADAEPPLFDRHHYSYVFSDLRHLEFRDGTFDRAVCVSTLEHVGMDNTRYGGFREAEPDEWITAAAEIVRVVKPGGHVLVTVPYGEAADHGWYHTFGPRCLQRIATLPGVARIETRYFFYDGAWYEASADEPVPQHHPDAVTGLAVLRLSRA